MTEFLRLADACAGWTSIDLANGIQATNIDESYLNR